MRGLENLNLDVYIDSMKRKKETYMEEAFDFNVLEQNALKRSTQTSSIYRKSKLIVKAAEYNMMADAKRQDALNCEDFAEALKSHLESDKWYLNDADLGT